MRSKRTRKKASTTAAKVGRALRRAAKDARRTARMHGVPIYVWETLIMRGLRPARPSRPGQPGRRRRTTAHPTIPAAGDPGAHNPALCFGDRRHSECRSATSPTRRLRRVLLFHCSSAAPGMLRVTKAAARLSCTRAILALVYHELGRAARCAPSDRLLVRADA
jgi:hypothetical protein